MAATGLAFDWTFTPAAFSTAKGLPGKDQHVDGAGLSGDLDGDERTGDSSCAPTAATSSLRWFASNGYPDLFPATGTEA